MLKRADLHLHTRFSRWKHLKLIKPRDSYSEPLATFEKARAAGMDFVAFTDHDSIDGALDLLSRRPDLEPELIIGEEVETYFPGTGQWVHVNVFGVNESIHADLARLRASIYELSAYLKSRKLFHVLNHPFQSYRLQSPPMRYIEEVLELFDHFEVGNCTLPARHNKAVAEMLDYAAALYTKKIGVGGSDAHTLRHVAFCHTEADVAEGGGKEAWLAAVARGEGRVVGGTIGAAGLAANVYRIIGQYYLSLRDPEVRRHMRAENYLAAAALAPACVAGLPAFLSLGSNLKLEAVTLLLRQSIRKNHRDSAARQSVPGFLEDPEA